MEIFWEIIEYIVLGLIQGITEVLPMSSSGHVTFAREMFNTDIDNSVFFLIVLNLGSIISIAYYLRNDIKMYFMDFNSYVFKKNREKSVRNNFVYVRNVFIGILPIMIVGFFVSYFIQDIYDLNSLIFIGVGALMTATILFAVRKQTTFHVNRDFTARDSIFIGIMQVFALFPGLSRLGVVTAAGVHRKLSLDSALKFAFMMLIPISFATIFYTLLDANFNLSVMMSNFDTTSYWSYIYYTIGFFVSLVTTYFALKFVFILFRKGKLEFFYIYNFVFGVVVLFIAMNR